MFYWFVFAKLEQPFVEKLRKPPRPRNVFFSGVVALFGWCALVDGFGGGFRKIAMLVGCIFVLSVPTGSRLDGGAIASSR